MSLLLLFLTRYFFIFGFTDELITTKFLVSTSALTFSAIGVVAKVFTGIGYIEVVAVHFVVVVVVAATFVVDANVFVSVLVLNTKQFNLFEICFLQTIILHRFEEIGFDCLGNSCLLYLSTIPWILFALIFELFFLLIYFLFRWIQFLCHCCHQIIIYWFATCFLISLTV